ncbi:hypothetical protein RchiOBHm_Chr2g0171611 [Rosa chinensis]|uniref:Uncharacterized protein n=1 Tax=Rosa chinensis TaxID=74649 RepID=A0A2P6S5E3_ROSCH|nr:hypothetical protein RchiOBHm_Chr2g0171611 [Rosa chinensis]
MVMVFYNYDSSFLHNYIIVEPCILFIALNMFSFLNCSSFFILVVSFRFPYLC